MGRILRIVVAVVVLALCFGVSSSADLFNQPVVDTVSQPVATPNAQDYSLSVRDYFQFGSYQGEPILWRCIDNSDENEMLLVSDKLLCFKPFDVDSPIREDVPGYEGLATPLDSRANNFNMWSASTLRAWMNSTAPAGAVQWPRNNPPVADVLLNGLTDTSDIVAYADEEGFLSDDNFTTSEKSVIKTVSQWTLLNDSKHQFSTNGAMGIYNLPVEGGQAMYGASTEELRQYPPNGYAQMVTDSMFLLDGTQFLKLIDCYGPESVALTSFAQQQNTQFGTASAYHSMKGYWLRDPVVQSNAAGLERISAFSDGSYFSDSTASYANGVRPAFYLNTANLIVESGFGTADDPYVIDGAAPQDGIAVYANGNEVSTDVPPVMDNGRVLVPARAISKSLGASVNWDANTNTVTVDGNGNKISMQINNGTMKKNGQDVQMDVPPQIIDNRTMVPIRAVAEALNAQVKWVPGLRRVAITYSPDIKVLNPPTKYGRYDFSGL